MCRNHPFANGVLRRRDELELATDGAGDESRTSPPSRAILNWPHAVYSLGLKVYEPWFN